MASVERAALASLDTLRLHRAVERLLVEAEAPRLHGVLDEIDRQTVRVVEPEGDVSPKHTTTRRGALNRFFQSRETASQDRVEAVLLAANDLNDRVTPRPQLGVCLAVLADESV